MDNPRCLKTILLFSVSYSYFNDPKFFQPLKIKMEIDTKAIII